MNGVEFDRFSEDYRALLDSNVALAGETSAYFAEYKARYLVRLLGGDFSGKILDFGCGIGLLSGFIKKHLPRSTLHGFDISRHSIEKVGRELKGQGLFTADRSRLERNYNLIVLANVMHHVPLTSRRELISDLSSSLATGGNLTIFEHNPWNPLTRWAVSHCAFDENAVLLRCGEARKYLINAGVRILKRDYIVFFPRLFSLFRPIEPKLHWLPLGAQYVMVGQK